MNVTGYSNMPEDKPPIQDFISSLCTAGSVLLLLYALVRNYVQDGTQPLETVLHDPLSFLFTLLPIGISVLVHLSKIIDEGFRGPETVAYIVKPVLRIVSILIGVALIFFLGLDMGLDLLMGLPFLKKYLALLGLSFLSGVCFAYLNSDSIWDCTLREIFIFSAVLCIVNSCIQTSASIHTLMSHGESLITAWSGGIIYFSFLYAISILGSLFIAVLEILVRLLGMK